MRSSCLWRVTEGEPLETELSKLAALPVQLSPGKFRDWWKGKAKKVPEPDYGSPLATRLEHMQPSMTAK